MTSIMQIKKAQRSAKKLRVGLFGISGSGKTLTGLKMLKGAGVKRIGMIDSEEGRGQMYGNEFDYDVIQLGADKSVDAYAAAINLFKGNGYDGLLIDSATHAWDSLKAEVEDLAQAKFKGNTWAAWNKGTPRQREFLETIMSYPGHVILTMRSKTLWEQVEENGKKKPQRVGVGFQQREGTEYEVDILIEMNAEHTAIIHKAYDSMNRFVDKIIPKPTEEFGRELAEWLADGKTGDSPVLAQAQPPALPTADPFIAEMDVQHDQVGLAAWWKHAADRINSLPPKEKKRVIDRKDELRKTLPIDVSKLPKPKSAPAPPAQPETNKELSDMLGGTPGDAQEPPLFDNSGKDTIPPDFGKVEVAGVEKAIAEATVVSDIVAISSMIDKHLLAGEITVEQSTVLSAKKNARFRQIMPSAA